MYSQTTSKINFLENFDDFSYFSENDKTYFVGLISYRSEISGNIAKYTRANFYKLGKNIFKKFAKELNLNKKEYRIFSNSLDIDEKLIAYKANLGSFGKNSLLYNERLGSEFVIAVLIVNKKNEFQSDLPKPIEQPPISIAECINCDKCFKACPTQAICKDGSGKLDADKCLQRIMISTEILSIEMSKKIGTKLYGCSICQDVCPINKQKKLYENKNKITDNELQLSYGFLGEYIDPTLLLQMTETEFLEKFAGNQITSKFVPQDAIRRNALINIFNSNIDKKEKIILLSKYSNTRSKLLQDQAKLLLEGIK